MIAATTVTQEDSSTPTPGMTTAPSTSTPPVFASFVGVDLHKCTVSLSACDSHGQIIARIKTSTKCVEKIDAFLADLAGPIHLVVEACPFIEWFIDRYRDRVARIDIADATQLAALRGKRRKTDRKDADDMAIRLSRGDCPLGWIADEQVSELRKLGRQWHRLARTLSRTKHSMRGILLQQNIPGPGRIEGDSAQRWLLAHGHLLKDIDRRNFGDLLAIVQTIERLQAPLKIQIIQANRSERFAGLIELLQSTPGIGDIWACLIAAEIGDFARFPNADALEFWAGLTPDLKESAGRTTSAGITKAGSRTLRWALGMAALTLCQSDAAQERVRQRILARCGGKKAKANVAMARRLLRILFAMTRTGAVYQVGQPTHRAAKANRVRLSNKRSSVPASAA
jgi:transposase